MKKRIFKKKSGIILHQFTDQEAIEAFRKCMPVLHTEERKEQ
jgi:hypothetical protein